MKIEIAQELTLERQAFEARMRIGNSLPDVALENVAIEVLFQDADGLPVFATSNPNHASALFFIRVDSMSGVSDVSGGGRIEAGSDAEIRWLIIPAVGAAQAPAGSLYSVGARLTYNFGGQYQEIEVAPDFIVVKPMPELTLDYFLTREVRANDPRTDQIEPSEPFTLGVRVRNDGVGTAQRVRIDTAQPRIVENLQRLLIGFEILQGFVDDRAGTPNLLLDFGAIPPGGRRMGRWLMQTTLAGEFVAFGASVTHADELGGQLTSLIRGAHTHLLVRDVRVDLPGRDAVRDFLASDPLRVYESDAPDSDVADVSLLSSITPLGQVEGNDVYSLAVPATAGLFFVSVPDPRAGQSTLRRVVRADGKVILPENAWLQTSGTGGEKTYALRLFDVNGGGTYRVELGAAPVGNRPPVLQFIPQRDTVEGGRISFLVEATDPDQTIPAISSPQLPAGASLVDQASGTAIFDWSPAAGQSGWYPITYRASDGVLTTSQTAVIHVCPEGEPDCPDATPTPTEAPSPTALPPSPTMTPPPSPTATATGTPTPTPTIHGTLTYTNAVGRPGGRACFGVALSGSLGQMTLLDLSLGYDPTRVAIGNITINPEIGPGSAANKSLQRSNLAPGLEGIHISGASGAAIPDGQLYSAELIIDPDAAPASYALQPGGEFIVSTCTGDCNGNEMVSIGEVTRCINMFLGMPTCSPVAPGGVCPIADANNDGGVSVGEVAQCVRQFFLSACP